MEIEEEAEPVMNEEENQADVESKTTDQQGYLARDEYTSERFKLELSNLPKYFGFGVSYSRTLIIGRGIVCNRI